jgi:alkanesulfonate monooxygenase SsuD/methylene tetrahydromethanopterin reductase-like flavin-dependent oxidoreductase (luciferase family)
LGDGWYPTIRNSREPLDTPALFAQSLADVRRHAEAAGRDPAAVDVAMFAPGYFLGEPQKGRDGQRVVFTGSAEQIAEDARGYAKAGVRHIVIGFEEADLQKYLDRIEAFTRDVMPLA